MNTTDTAFNLFPVCRYCHDKALKICSTCQTSLYCSKECQFADVERHSKVCKRNTKIDIKNASLIQQFCLRLISEHAVFSSLMNQRYLNYGLNEIRPMILVTNTSQKKCNFLPLPENTEIFKWAMNSNVSKKQLNDLAQEAYWSINAESLFKRIGLVVLNISDKIDIFVFGSKYVDALNNQINAIPQPLMENIFSLYVRLGEESLQPEAKKDFQKISKDIRESGQHPLKKGGYFDKFGTSK